MLKHNRWPNLLALSMTSCLAFACTDDTGTTSTSGSTGTETGDGDGDPTDTETGTTDSTTGDGDAPDNARHLEAMIARDSADLSGTQVSVLALGEGKR